MPALARLNLAISLPLRNTNDLARLIQDLYNPASPRFHHYLTPTQFTEQFGPTPADYESVKSFSKANGFEILGTHPNRTLVDVRASVENIENAFHLHLNRYPHPVENRTFFSPDTEPSLNLTAQVLYISGLSDFIKPHPTIAPFKPDNSAPLGSPMGVGSATNGAFIGKDFRAAYASNVTLTGAGESVGLFELGGGYYPSDITTYESEAGLPNVPITPVLLDGYDGSPGVWEVNTEVSLDIEMAISMAPGLDQVLVYEGYLPDSILSQMATDDIAKQLSASWVYGIDAESQQLYQQFATQGQSFFNSSGDGGAWGNSISTPCDDPYITIAGWLDCGVRGRCVWPAAFHVSMDVKRNEHFRRNWTVTCHHQCPITADRNLHNRDQQRVRRRCRCACSPCHCDCVQRDGKL
jgi:subtilase family serine protease